MSQNIKLYYCRFLLEPFRFTAQVILCVEPFIVPFHIGEYRLHVFKDLLNWGTHFLNTLYADCCFQFAQICRLNRKSITPSSTAWISRLITCGRDLLFIEWILALVHACRQHQDVKGQSIRHPLLPVLWTRDWRKEITSVFRVLGSSCRFRMFMEIKYFCRFLNEFQHSYSKAPFHILFGTSVVTLLQRICLAI
jgi:hypothetical protein